VLDSCLRRPYAARPLRGLLLALGLVLLHTLPASAVNFINPRDVIVVDQGAKSLVLVERGTGNRKTFSRGGATSPVGAGPAFQTPTGVIFSPDGATLYVADSGAGGVFAVDRFTGDRTLLSAAGAVGAGPPMVGPTDLTVDALGTSLLVACPGDSSIIKVALATGDRSVLASPTVGTGPALLSPRGIALLEPGPLTVVVDSGAKAVFIIAPDGSRTTLSDNTFPPAFNFFSEPVALEPRDNGNLWVMDRGNGILFEVYPPTGERFVASGGSVGFGVNFVSPAGISFSPTSSPSVMVVADPGCNCVITARTAGGQRDLFSGTIFSTTIGTGDAFTALAGGVAVAAAGPTLSLDYGDAPATYGTRLADDGARHIIDGLFMGSTITAEADALFTNSADGDSDDGVTFPEIDPLLSEELVVVASAAGIIDAWVDFDSDGTFDDPRDRIIAGAPVIGGSNSLTFTAPGPLTAGPRFARVRLSHTGTASPIGCLTGGEVSDFVVQIAPPSMNLSLSATPGATSVAAGGPITHTLHWENAGNATTSLNVLRVDVPGVASVDAGGSDPNFVCQIGLGGALFCELNVGNLAPGQTGSAVITLEVDASLPAGIDVLAVPASLTGKSGLLVDTDPSDNTLTVETPIDAAPDLSLTATDGGVTVTPGQTINYTLQASQGGTQNATAVTMLATVPPDTKFVAAGSSSGWSCPDGAAAGSACLLEVGNLAVGAQATRTFRVAVLTTLPAGRDATPFEASVADDADNGPDPTPLDNFATESTPITAAPDLFVTIVDNGLPATPGTPQIYPLEWWNFGDQGAANVTLTVLVPTHATFNAAESASGFVCTATPSGQSCTLALGLVPADTGDAVAFAVDIAAPVAAGIDTVVTVASIEDDGQNGAEASLDDNTAQVVTAIDAAPDLSVSLSLQGASEAAPGTAVKVRVAWENGGSQDATGASIAAVLPSGVTFQAAASSAGWSCIGGACTLAVGALPAGASQQADLVFAVPNSVGPGVNDLSVSATVSDDGANGPDAGPGDEVAALLIPLDAAPDLALTLPGGQAAVPGDHLTWTFSWSNLGDQTAVGVVLQATLPPAVTFDAAASTPGWSCPSSAAGAVCTFTLGTINAGASGGNVFALTLDDSVPAGLDAIAVALTLADDGANGADQHPQDNSGALEAVIVALPDLAVTIEDGGGVIGAGDAFSWAILVENHGTRDTTGVTVDISVPTGATFDAAGSDAAFDCGAGTPGSACSAAIGDVEVGSPVLLFFGVTFPETIPAGLESVQVVVAVSDDLDNGLEPSLLDNLDEVTTPVAAAPDLFVSLDDADAVAEIGGPITYAIAYGNRGDQDASGWSVSVQVPAHTSFVAADSDAFVCVPDGLAGATCVLSGALLAAGASEEAVFAVVVDDPLASGAIGVAVAATITDDEAGGPDPTPDDRTSGESTPIDTHPTVSVASASVAEGGGQGALALTLSRPTGLPVVVPWQTTETGTATPGLDFGASTSSANFAPGETSGEIVLVVTDDLLDELDETVEVTLGAATGATVDAATATLTITDDDAAPGVALADAQAFEEDGSLVFEVTLDAPSGLVVTVGWETSDGTAQAGPDYVDADGTVEFAPGETSKQVSVSLVDDTVDEDDESMELLVTGTTNAGPTLDGEAVGTILDDDQPPPVSVGDVTVDEDAGVAVVTVTLAHSSGLPVTVGYQTADGTATAPGDYAAASGQLVVPAKSKTATVEIAIVDDDADESTTPETFTFTLTSVENGVLVDAEATVSITDDDATPAGQPDAYSTDEDEALVVAAPGVLENDEDGDGGALTVAVASAPAVGSLALSPDGGFTWTAPADFNGPASFTYTVSDGSNTSAPVAVTLTVVPVNDAPVVAAEAALTMTDVAEDAVDPPGDSVSALWASGGAGVVSDVDGDTDPGAALVAVDGANGVWEWSADGGDAWAAVPAVSEASALLLGADALLRFVPGADFDGAATATLRAWDGSAGAAGDEGVDVTASGGSSAVSATAATASVTVVPSNDAPVFVAPTPEGPLEATEGQALTFQIAVADPDGPAAQLGVAPLPPGATVDAATGAFEWTPTWKDGGSLTLVLSATDGTTAISREVVVTVSILDVDADGVPDGFEEEANLSTEGGDSDGDTISDAEEVGDPLAPADTDDDGVIDALDDDSDGDGIPDVDEAGDADPATPAVDTDDDDTPDFQDTDSDGDGAEDGVDVCPLVADLDQGDLDLDGVGDACDDDIDGDGLTNADEEELDLSPTDPDTDHDGVSDGDEVGDVEDAKDTDDDGIIDALDDDSDGDGTPDAVEIGDDDPTTEPVDTDDDGVPDYLDLDSDGDGVPDKDDLCRLVTGSGPDSDDDGQGDPCDGDDDGDGVDDATDNCPGVANEDQADADDDGEGDLCDGDDDNDGVPDAIDNCPGVDDVTQIDTDDDGQGDACDGDDDGDGADDAVDNCPLVTNGDQADEDGDGIGDACDEVTPPVEEKPSIGGGCGVAAGGQGLGLWWLMALGLALWLPRRRRRAGRA
jgi:uncharacterized repeat protein (TIGR01451 family)